MRWLTLQQDEAELTDTRDKQEKKLLAIARIFDIEEDIWSPTYGLKGKIDASVQATVADVEDGPVSPHSKLEIAPSLPPMDTA